MKLKATEQLYSHPGDIRQFGQGVFTDFKGVDLGVAIVGYRYKIKGSVMILYRELANYGILYSELRLQ